MDVDLAELSHEITFGECPTPLTTAIHHEKCIFSIDCMSIVGNIFQENEHVFVKTAWD